MYVPINHISAGILKDRYGGWVTLNFTNKLSVGGEVQEEYLPVFVAAARVRPLLLKGYNSMYLLTQWKEEWIAIC